MHNIRRVCSCFESFYCTFIFHFFSMESSYKLEYKHLIFPRSRWKFLLNFSLNPPFYGKKTKQKLWNQQVSPCRHTYDQRAQESECREGNKCLLSVLGTVLESSNTILVFTRNSEEAATVIPILQMESLRLRGDT